MLLNKQQVAERFSTSVTLARATLASHGVLPIDFGRGKGRGPRWLSEAVDAVILTLHEDAQIKAKPRKTKILRTSAPLSALPASDIYELTKAQPLQ